MKVLFIISNSETAFWLSEVTHPYWHLVERGVEVDFASPKGGKVIYDPYSDPYFVELDRARRLGQQRIPLRSEARGQARCTTLKLRDVDLSKYDAVHVAGGRGGNLSISFPAKMSPRRLSTSGRSRKSSGPSAMARSRLGIIPTGSAGAS